MDPIDWAALLQSAPQLTTAILFGYFILRFLARQDAQIERRDGEWRAFLLTARSEYLGSVTAIVAEVKSLTTAVTATHGAITEHDIWSKSETVKADAVRTVTAAALAAETVRVAAEVAARVVAKERQSGGG